jgi:hypothetical protein
MRVFATEGPIEPAASITLIAMRPEASQYLETHGCTIVEKPGLVIVIYPQGATRQEMYPRTTCERYRVLLPDGTELREVHTRHMHGENFLLYLAENPTPNQE